MIIEIKKALLEGYSYEEITEAVHANHPNLNKKNPENSENRKKLVDDIRKSRRTRDEYRKEAANIPYGGYKRELNQKANYYDNNARGESQTGGKSPVFAAEYKNVRFPKMEIIPREVSSAKE